MQFRFYERATVGQIPSISYFMSAYFKGVEGQHSSSVMADVQAMKYHSELACFASRIFSIIQFKTLSNV